MGLNFLGRRGIFSGMPSNPITTPSTGTTLQAGGVYLLSSTVALKNWNLRAPQKNEVGMTVELHAVKCTTSLVTKVTLSNASLYSTVSSTSVTKDTIRMGRADMSATLRAISTAKWKAITLVNSPTITTS